jgi:phosphatidylserine decarboxylase
MAPWHLIVAAASVAALAFAFWRFVWFYRDPPRVPPAEAGLLSPADGTVVYVKRAAPGEKVIAIKRGLEASIEDILREDVAQAKLIVGVFMSPFDVHVNRVPLDARVVAVRHHEARGEGNVNMGPMHWRSLLGIEPRYTGSTHIVRNERAVTVFEGRYRGQELRAYVVQIGALAVNGIESFVQPGMAVVRGEKFGMISIGSQVDLIVPFIEGMEARVAPGDNVRAGETILVR